MPSLANVYLSFVFDANTGRWGLYPRQGETPFLEEVRFGATYAVRAKSRIHWDGAIQDCRVEPPVQVDSPHGRLAVLRARLFPSLVRLTKTSREGVGWELDVEFALPEDNPFLIWRIVAHNVGAQAITLDSIDLAIVGPKFSSGSRGSGLLAGLVTPAASLGQTSAGAARLHTSPGRLAFFTNGYQSWSYTGALQSYRRQPVSLFGPLGDPKRINLLTPVFDRVGHFTSDMFGALGDLDHKAGLVLGFLTQSEQFGMTEAFLDRYAPSLRLTAQCDGVALPPGEARATDWAYLQFVALDDFDPLIEYVEAVARENGARVPLHTPVGWCSWYHYFDKVTEQDFTRNLEAIARQRERFPLEFVQLDDGHQAKVGDWFETNAKFPHGLAWLSGQIRAQGHMPGLWLAPFMVRSDARLMREHPDWLLRAAGGRPVNAGYNWFRWCYGLDPTHPGVREHTRKLIQTAVNAWGFPYLKLDFLYAAALPARRYDAQLTRAQALRQALKDIRAAAGPEAFLLGCGCPLGPAIGLVDGMRISTDVAPNWKPELFTPPISQLLRHEMDFPCAYSAIRNTVNRAPLHRRWWINDPDCLLVRDHDTHLNEHEIRSLATVIALSGGMFLVSDDMTRLNPERYRYIAPLMPVLGASARARRWLDSDTPDIFVLPLSGPHGAWLVAGIFNWEDRPRDRVVDLLDASLGFGPADYWASDFWEGAHTRVECGRPLTFTAIPPHGCHLLALCRVTAAPTLVASSFHFSQGAEIAEWQTAPAGLQMKIALGRAADGEMRLSLPAAPRAVMVDGDAVTAVDLGGGVYALRFSVKGAAGVEVRW